MLVKSHRSSCFGFAFDEFASESLAASFVNVVAEGVVDAEVEGISPGAFIAGSTISTSASFSVDGGFTG